MRIRLMQILLFIPCCAIDGIFLGAIALPLWIVCGINPITHEPITQWLFELKKEDKQ
tara:strand:+ start:1363 stop:1533 length:171 start_codon:yes stop_codon:yes gene_type:complete